MKRIRGLTRDACQWRRINAALEKVAEEYVREMLATASGATLLSLLRAVSEDRAAGIRMAEEKP